MSIDHTSPLCKAKAPTTLVVEYENTESQFVYKNHELEPLEPEYFYQEYILLSVHNERIAELHRNLKQSRE